MNEGTPLWNSPASSVASVAGSIVRESTVEPTRLHNKELIPTRVTARMIRTATVVGLLVAVSFYILGGSMLLASVQDPAISGIPVHEVNIATAQTMTTATTTLRHVERAEVKNSRTEGVSDDSVLFLPGFGAPREKQVRRSNQNFSLRRGDDTMGGVFLSVLLPFWPFALICVTVLVVSRLIGGPCLDYYVWYVNSMLAWSE